MKTTEIYKGVELEISDELSDDHQFGWMISEYTQSPNNMKSYGIAGVKSQETMSALTDRLKMWVDGEVIRSQTTIAIDASTSSTGVAVMRGTELIHTAALQPPKGMRGGNRLQWLYEAISKLFRDYQPGNAVLEGYAMGIPGQSGMVLMELGGVIRLLCAQKGITISVVAPCSNKKAFTGSGKATKEQMTAEAQKRFPAAVITTDDVADAIGLACYGKTLHDEA